MQPTPPTAPQRVIFGRPTALTRLAAAAAVLPGTAFLGMVIWLITHGYRTSTLPGSIFFAILPLLLAAWALLGARSLWRGNPAGGGMVRATLSLPLILFVGGLSTVPFLRNLEN